ncbi:MAG: DUF1289 domain-containing protein [Steroidobacteraceae bacterium]
MSSPCVRNCCLDDNGTCLGCFRSLEEIKEWGIADNPRRLVIQKKAARRRQECAIRNQPWTVTRIA